MKRVIYCFFDVFDVYYRCGMHGMQMHKSRFSGRKYHRKFSLSFLVCSCVFLWCVVLCLGVSGVSAGSYTPAAPSGPSYGYVNVEYEYLVVSTNRNASWLFDWGDGSVSAWVSLKDNESSVSAVHQWESPGEYAVRVMFKSMYFPDGVWSYPLEVVIFSDEAGSYLDVPEVVVGSDMVGVDEVVSVCVGCSDVDFVDGLRYRVDWGDGVQSEWSRLSVDEVFFEHRFDVVGVYNIRGQACDRYDVVSDWADSVGVEVVDEVGLEVDETGFTGVPWWLLLGGGAGIAVCCVLVLFRLGILYVYVVEE